MLGLLGLPLGYNLLILIRLVTGGLLAKAFVEELAAHHGADKAQARRGGFLAGLAVTGTPMLIAGVHNGTSEAANASGLIVALWAFLMAAAMPFAAYARKWHSAPPADF